MSLYRYFFPDFLEIQRDSFLNFLKEGILEEFSKRNPITNRNKSIEIFFYPEYFCLTKPDYSIQQAIFLKKSYTSKLYIPVQFTDKKQKNIFLKWILIAQLPLMTKRGHFVLNGAARVIMNQLVRSPGVYFRENFYEIYLNKWISKPNKILKRFYADIICLKGTWIRIEIDKDFCMWVRLKKGPKIPLLWFLLGMGLTEKMIFQSVISPNFLLKSFQKIKIKNEMKLYSPEFISKNKFYLDLNFNLDLIEKKKISDTPHPYTEGVFEGSTKKSKDFKKKDGLISMKYPYISTTPEAWKEIAKLLNLKKTRGIKLIKSTQLTSLSTLGFRKKKLVHTPFGGKRGNNLYPTLHQSTSVYGVRNNFYPKIINTNLKNFSPSQNYNKEKLNKKNSGFNSFVLEENESKISSKTSSFLINKNLDNTTNILSQNILKNKIQFQNLFGQTLQKSSKFAKFQEKFDNVTLGRKWFFQRFMNPRTYDLGKKGRLSLNQKLGLTIEQNQTTLTAIDLLFITNYLMKVEKGLYSVDDIDHLKNKRIRSAGELIQMQFGIGLMRLEKIIRLKLNAKSKKTKTSYKKTGKTEKNPKNSSKLSLNHIIPFPGGKSKGIGGVTKKFYQSFFSRENILNQKRFFYRQNGTKIESFWFNSSVNKMKLNQILTPKIFKRSISFNSYIEPKYVNGALKEFFGTHPLSQFMDQINPLAEITHKRRLSSLGPGGVSRDTATLAIRGIHSSHYGRICPIETPEGKNTGLVNSLTVYARVNVKGLIEAPFYSLYKGQIQKSLGKFYLSPAEEEKFQTATSDLNITKKNFLPNQKIPIRFGKSFFTDSPKYSSFIGVSPLQMISLATSLIPFLEHDDANRALMGSNMQRQAVPLIKPKRPFVGTGLEAKAASDSGHALTSSKSGFVLYVSGSEIFILNE